MPTLDDLTNALRGADWYYEYSDDYDRYRQGAASVHDATVIFRELKAQGGELAVEAERLWEEFYPYSSTNQSAA